MVQLLSTPLDRSFIETGDQREQGIAASTDPSGLDRSEPPTLLLVQAIHQEVHLTMQLSVRMFDFRSAVTAAANVDFRRGHRGSRFVEVGGIALHFSSSLFPPSLLPNLFLNRY
jgi:hypothetical protein